MPIITKEIIEEQIDNVQNQIESVQLPDKTGIAILIIAIMALFFIPKVISFFLKLIGVSIIGFGLYTILLT
tara:strand:- start:321 stop:533 length:213 start_codon:yes stop_codon:yes gene_type:complete